MIILLLILFIFSIVSSNRVIKSPRNETIFSVEFDLLPEENNNNISSAIVYSTNSCKAGIQ